MNIFIIIGRLFRGEPSCQDINRFLVEYIDDELPLDTRKQFERHLDLCPSCRTYFEQYSETIRLVREDDVDIPAGLAEHTLEFLRSTSDWH